MGRSDSDCPSGSSKELQVTRPRRKHRGCVRVTVHRDCCYVAFGQRTAVVVGSEKVGTSCRGETMVADFDADGRILGIELIGAKPCQMA